MKKKFAIIGLVVLILVVSIGLSYAFLLPIIEGFSNEEAIRAGDMVVTIEDGPKITIKDIMPGESIQKTFNIKNTGRVVSAYQIYLSEVFNTFATKSELKYTLTSTNNGAQVTTQTTLPSETSLIATGTIEPNVTQTFTLKIEFLDLPSNDINNMNKDFGAKIQINEYKNVDTYLVNLDPNGGTASTLSVNVPKGGSYQGLPTPTKSGYSFKGWLSSDNLISTDAADWEQGAITDATGMNPNGTMTTRLRLKDYLKVIPNQEYIMTTDSSTDIVIRLVWFYDENKNFITTSTGSATSGFSVDSVRRFTVPSNCSYIRTVLQYKVNTTDIPISDLENAKPTLKAVVNNGSPILFDRSHSLIADWDLNIYTVSLDANGGSVSSSNITVSSIGTYQNLPTPTWQGHTFDGWVTVDNLISTDVADWEQDGIIDATGLNNNSGMTTRLRLKNYLKVIPNQEYIMTTDSSSDIVIRLIWFYDENKNFISSTQNGNANNNSSFIRFSIPNNCYYIRTVLQYKVHTTEIPISDLENAKPALKAVVNNNSSIILEKDHTLMATWSN